jgi:hypothetical protein
VDKLARRGNMPLAWFMCGGLHLVLPFLHRLCPAHGAFFAFVLHPDHVQRLIDKINMRFGGGAGGLRVAFVDGLVRCSSPPVPDNNIAC